MKNQAMTCNENVDDDLRHYVHERPDLLLKMLDIAEACSRERENLALQAMPRTRHVTGVSHRA